MSIEEIRYAGVIASSILFIACVIFDLYKKKIPNQLIFPAMLIAFGWCVYLCTLNFWSGGLRFILFLAIFAFGASGLIGLGDIKLFMTLALLNPPTHILLSIAVAAILLVIVQLIKDPKKTWEKVKFSLFCLQTNTTAAMPKPEESKEKEQIPFVPYMALAYCIVYWGGRLFQCI